MGENKNFTLPERKVTVKYIKRRRGMASDVDDSHVISGNMLKGSTRKYTVPMQRNGSLVNVLTNEEKAYLEDVMGGVNLSIYSTFWNDTYVPLNKSVNTLNLSNPSDYVSYKILLANSSLIAPTWDSRNDKMSYEFVIVEEGAELKSNKKKYDAKKEAFKLYGKIEDDRSLLLGVLKLLTNKPLSTNPKLEWLQAQVEEKIDTEPSKFVDLIRDGSFHTKLLINEGVTLGVINKESNKYITADGLSLCEADELPTFSNAVRYLDSDKNEEIRSLIEAKINNAK